MLDVQQTLHLFGDFVQPSVAKMGGISELCKIFPTATVSNITVMPHCFYDGPGLLAAVHVAAALGTADAMIEWRFFDLEAQLYGGPIFPERSDPGATAPRPGNRPGP
jgi:L-alanine-DL-glutamate epimerase-like enolase superfamily enzyme